MVLILFFFLYIYDIIFLVIYMNIEKRNKYILVFVVVIMLLVIIILGMCVILNKQTDEVVVSLRQVYVSDYELKFLDEKYLYGTNDGKINLIIKNNGTQVYHDDIGISYDEIYSMGDNKYLFCTDREEVLECFLFNGTNFSNLFRRENVTYAIPLLYEDIDGPTIIGFVEHKDEDLYIYSLDDKEPIIIKNTSLVGDRFLDYKYYIHDKNNIITISNNKYGAINLNGEVTMDYLYQDLYSIGNNRYIVKNNNKYGIINNDKEEIIPIKYKIIKWFKDGFLIGNSKLAIYDSEFNKISKEEITTNIMDYVIREDNSLKLDKVRNNYLVSNNYEEDIKDSIYNYHDLYVLRNNKINKIEEKGYGSQYLIYTYYNNKLRIYNDAFTEKESININIDKIKNVIKIDDN